MPLRRTERGWRPARYRLRPATEPAVLHDRQHEDEDEQDERMVLLSMALDKLEADEKALVTLYYMEEKSMSELAFILGITEGNVKVKLYRIRKKLYWLMNQGK